MNLEPTTNGATSQEPRGGYGSRGLTAHDKPTGSNSQYTLTNGEMPGFAYWLRSQELELFRRLARIAARGQTGLEQIQQSGLSIFNGVWGIFEKRYEAEIEAVRLDLSRLNSTREALQHELNQTPSSIPVDPTPGRLPRGLPLAGWLALWLLILIVCLGEGQMVANLIHKVDQNWITAWFSGGILLMAVSIAAKIAVDSFIGSQQTRGLKLTLLVGCLAFLGWATCFAQTYATALTLDQLASGGAAEPDRRWLVWAQLILGPAAVIWLMAGTRKLQLYPLVKQLNPTWDTLRQRDQELVQAIKVVTAQLGDAQGRLLEYQACRNSFVAVGTAEFQAALELNQLINERRKGLDGF